MIRLFTINWKFEISIQGAGNRNMKKWNKVTIMPLADNLKNII